MGSINAYKVQYANVQQGEPRDDDFMILQVRPEICRMLVLHRRLYLTKQ